MNQLKIDVISLSFSFYLQQGDAHSKKEVKLSIQNAAEGRNDVCFCHFATEWAVEVPFSLITGKRGGVRAELN